MHIIQNNRRIHDMGVGSIILKAIQLIRSDIRMIYK